MNMIKVNARRWCELETCKSVTVSVGSQRDLMGKKVIYVVCDEMGVIPTTVTPVGANQVTLRVVNTTDV